MYEVLPVTVALERRQNENAGEVVAFRRQLLLREIAEQLLLLAAARALARARRLVRRRRREHVEEEVVDVVVQRLVVEEELGEEAQALAVQPLASPVHLAQPQRALLVHERARQGAQPRAPAPLQLACDNAEMLCSVQ